MLYSAWIVWSPYKSLRFMAIARDDGGEQAIREMGCTVITHLGAGTFPTEQSAIDQFRTQAGPVYDVIRLWIPVDGKGWTTEA